MKIDFIGRLKIDVGPGEVPVFLNPLRPVDLGVKRNIKSKKGRSCQVLLNRSPDSKGTVRRY